MELDVQPGHVDSDTLDVQPGHVDAARPMTLGENARYAMNMDLPVLSDVGKGLDYVGKKAQESAGEKSSDISELGAQAGNFVAKKTGSPTMGNIVSGLGQAAGVAAGLPEAAGSFAADAGAMFIPTKVKDVAAMVAGEGIIGGIAKTMPGVTKFFAEAPISEHLQAAIAAAKELGIPLSTQEISNTKTFQALNALLRRSPLTAGAMDAFDAQRAQAMQDSRAKILATLAPAQGRAELGSQMLLQVEGQLAKQDATRGTAYAGARAATASGMPSPALPEARGEALRGAINKNQAAAKMDHSQLYAHAEDALPVPGNTDAVKLPVAPLQQAAEGVLKGYGGEALDQDAGYRMASKLAQGNQDVVESQRILGKYFSSSYEDAMAKIKKNPQLLGLLQPGERQIVQSAMTDSGSISLTQLQSYIKQLGDMARNENNSGGGRTSDFSYAGANLLKLKSSAQQMVSDYYNGLGGEAAARYQLADAFHGDYARTFRNDRVASMFKGDPVGVLDTVLKKGNVDDVRTLARAVGPDADGQAVLRRQLFDRVFGPPTTTTTNAVGQAVEKVNILSVVDVAQKMSEYGPAVRALLSPSEQAQWVKFAKTGEDPVYLTTAYEDRVRQLVSRGDPLDVISAAMSGDNMTARAVKRYVSPQLWKGVQGQLAEEILLPKAGASEAAGGGVLGRLAKYDNPAGRRYLETVFGDPGTVRGMFRVGTAQRLLPGYGDLARAPAADGGAALRFVSSLGSTVGAAAGAAGEVAFGSRGPVGVGIGAAGGAIIGNGAFVIGGQQLARMFTTEEGQRTLTTLMRMPATDSRLPTLLKTLARAGYLYHPAPSMRDGQNARIAAP